jgi:hypothetical protein
MSVLMPDLASALRERATELARAEHARRRRRRQWVQRGGATLGLLLVTGATATALDLWNPPIGSNSGSAPSATAAPPPEAITAEIAALREPQAEADRGEESRKALVFPATENTTVHVTSVRVLGATSKAELVVLVPTTGPDGEELCLWVGRLGANGNRACAASDQALEGGLVVTAGRGSGDANDPKIVEARRRAGEQQTGSGPGVVQLPPEAAPTKAPAAAIGFAPDGVRSATVAGVTARVRRNFFEATLPTESHNLRATFTR